MLFEMEAGKSQKKAKLTNAVTESAPGTATTLLHVYYSQIRMEMDQAAYHEPSTGMFKVLPILTYLS